MAGAPLTSAVVFDIGTNTVRCLAFRDGVESFRSHRVVRLGQGVDATGGFAPEAIDRAVAGLAALASEAGPYDLRDAVATSATRDASNRGLFLDRAEAVLGVRPRVIPGDEEAAFSFAGALAGFGAGEAGMKDPALVIDVGGGSTEFVLGRSSPQYAISVDMGSVRLTERVIPERPSVRVAEAMEEAMRAFGVVDLPERPGVVVGVAGTFTALAAIDLDLATYDRSVVHHHAVTTASLDRIIDSLAAMTIAETEAIPSLEAARAPVLLGGAIVVRAALEVAGADSVVVSEHDLLDGLMANLLTR
jgi:exopolyphosphatase/guanosine-5'-triphosphate,3'-diphosphate pyrophosphatase